MPEAAASGTTSSAANPWNGTIDGWVRDPAIRTFLLQILALLIGGFVLTVVFASGALAVLLPSVFAKAIAAGCTGTVIGGGYWLRRRDRRKPKA